MPKPNPKELLRTAANYIKQHPEELVRALRGAFGLRVGLPLDALRYFVAEFAQGKKAPKDVVIEAVPPGLRIALTVAAMGTTLRARLTIFVEGLELSGSEALVTARISDMDLEVLDGMDTPVAGLIKSGALDLSKPGNLVAYMPKRPPMLVDAKDDRVVIDLLKVPKIAENPKARRMLSVVTPVLTIARIVTKDDHLDIHFKASPSRLSEAIAAAQSAA
ncbi:MAG: hypothetical protein R3B72_14665 [Polyangiaceae bacterium]